MEVGWWGVYVKGEEGWGWGGGVFGSAALIEEGEWEAVPEVGMGLLW